MTGNQLKIAAVVHAYHVDVLPSLLERLVASGLTNDVYITVCPERQKDVENICRSVVPEANVLVVENNGYDLRPFLSVIPELLDLWLVNRYRRDIEAYIRSHGAEIQSAV